MPRGGRKRGLDIVDLTDDPPNPPKRAAVSPASNGSGYQPRAVYATSNGYNPTPSAYHTQRPSHAAAHTSSSQTVPSSQWEPDVLDLTQDDEGPERELYSTLGKLRPSSVHNFANMAQMERLWASGITMVSPLPANLYFAVVSPRIRYGFNLEKHGCW